MEAARANGNGTREPFALTLFKGAATTAVLAMVPLLFSIQGALSRNCEASAAALKSAQAVVRVDNDLAKAKNRDLRRLLLTSNQIDCS